LTINWEDKLSDQLFFIKISNESQSSDLIFVSKIPKSFTRFSC